MTEMPQGVRPLSPHLQIYRLRINMLMSILHRITGAALYLGTLLLAAWLMGIAMGEEAYGWVAWFLGHPLGKLVLIGYSFALLHHMLGGIRYLIWDTGRGFAIWQVDLMCWLTIAASVALTVVIWALALLHGA